MIISLILKIIMNLIFVSDIKHCEIENTSIISIKKIKMSLAY